MLLFKYRFLLFKLLDPSGVWMGPPDKREPKVSSNIFELPYSNINVPATVDTNNTKIRSNLPSLESKEDKDDNLKENAASINLIPTVKNNEIRKESTNSESESSPVVFRKVLCNNILSIIIITCIKTS